MTKKTLIWYQVPTSYHRAEATHDFCSDVMLEEALCGRSFTKLNNQDTHTSILILICLKIKMCSRFLTSEYNI